MHYNAEGFALALGPTEEPIRLLKFLHFGIDLPSPDAVRALRDLVAEDVTIVEERDEPEYVSVKCLDPDGYVVEAAWEPHTPPARPRLFREPKVRAVPPSHGGLITTTHRLTKWYLAEPTGSPGTSSSNGPPGR